MATKRRRKTPVRPPRPSKVSRAVMVRVPLAVLDDLWATAVLRPHGRNWVWSAADPDRVPLRALIRDALSATASRRIAHNVELAKGSQLPRGTRMKPRSTRSDEVRKILGET